MKPTFLTLLLATLIGLSANAGNAYYRMTPDLQEAYDLILDLKLAPARQRIQQAQRQQPDNLMVDFLEDYLDFYYLLVDGSKKEYQARLSHKNTRLKAFESGDILSPYYLFTKAEVKIHWAILETQYGDMVSAFRELRSAYKLLQANQNQFPGFKANEKSLGMLHTIFSAIPDEYQWGARMLGVRPDYEKGYRQIQNVLRYSETHDFLFARETRMIYAFLLLSLSHEQDQAWNMIQHRDINPRTSLMATYLKTLVALRSGRNDAALQTLQQRPEGGDYLDVPQLTYWEGVAQLRKQNAQADATLKQYLRESHSADLHKATYLQLAYHASVFGTSRTAQQYLQKCQTLGTTDNYEDKRALIMATDFHDPALIKAQLLLDGGYYTAANAALRGNTERDFSRSEDRIKFYFLKARVAERLKQWPQAIKYYKACIELDSRTDYYYVCYSMLLLGELYESRGKRSEAAQYYRACAQQKSNQNAAYYHKQAKDGLKRVR